MNYWHIWGISLQSCISKRSSRSSDGRVEEGIWFVLSISVTILCLREKNKVYSTIKERIKKGLKSILGI